MRCIEKKCNEKKQANTWAAALEKGKEREEIITIKVIKYACYFPEYVNPFISSQSNIMTPYHKRIGMTKCLFWKNKPSVKANFF